MIETITRQSESFDKSELSCDLWIDSLHRYGVTFRHVVGVQESLLHMSAPGYSR